MQRVSDVMTRDVKIARPEQTIRDAAIAMAEGDLGSLPVGENDRLVGMVTDRDIVLRAIAKGRGNDTVVREVMTERIDYCFDDEDVSAIAKKMADLGVHRLPVISRDKRLVGIVSLSNIAQTKDHGASAETLLKGVATPH